MVFLYMARSSVRVSLIRFSMLCVIYRALAMHAMRILYCVSEITEPLYLQLYAIECTLPIENGNEIKI